MKTTVYLQPELLRAAKVEAARTGKRGYEVFEEALRAYLGFGVVKRVSAASDLPEQGALELAYAELHRARE
jgi:hypothetical protein